MWIGQIMPLPRLPFRDPRTVARDIPGVLDVLFPRLSGGLVMSLNKRMFSFPSMSSISEELLERSSLQKAMLFELSMARVERELAAGAPVSWEDCLQVAIERQSQHYDARIPEKLEETDIEIATLAARNLVGMLSSVQSQCKGLRLEAAPRISGMGWIASGNGDFALGETLIEVKHSARNFGANDFRQVLMYWLLKYGEVIESGGAIWSDVLFLNPRRNAGLALKFDYLLSSASGNLSRVELLELLKSMVGPDLERR